jgi:hypothetical protein
VIRKIDTRELEILAREGIEVPKEEVIVASDRTLEYKGKKVCNALSIVDSQSE